MTLPARSKIMQRVLVVPWSMAATYVPSGIRRSRCTCQQVGCRERNGRTTRKPHAVRWYAEFDQDRLYLFDAKTERALWLGQISPASLRSLPRRTAFSRSHCFAEHEDIVSQNTKVLFRTRSHCSQNTKPLFRRTRRHNFVEHERYLI